MYRSAPMIAALVLLGAVAAHAGTRSEHVSGIVGHVDPLTNMVYFTDGRTLHLQPGTTIVTNDGRPLALSQVTPGMRLDADVALNPAVAPNPAPAVAATPAPALAAVSGHPPVNASGVVAAFDPANHIVTFQDGRMMKLTDRSTVWDRERFDAIKPGEQVMIRHGQPMGFRSAWDANAVNQHRMGTVQSVDPARTVVVLADGTTVSVRPSTRMTMSGQPMTLAQLQPGDEVVIVGTPHAAAVPMTASPRSYDAAGMALPRQTMPPAAMFDASEIEVMRPQAP